VAEGAGVSGPRLGAQLAQRGALAGQLLARAAQRGLALRGRRARARRAGAQRGERGVVLGQALEHARHGRRGLAQRIGLRARITRHRELGHGPERPGAGAPPWHYE